MIVSELYFRKTLAIFLNQGIVQKEFEFLKSRGWFFSIFFLVIRQSYFQKASGTLELC